jgi:DNA-binding transcriptional regulator YhcF (GntR family)
MILTIEVSGPVPAYLQIYQQVMAAVAAGRLREGDTLPSTRQLARDLRVNYHTVHRAYDLLVAGGVIAMEPRRKAVIRAYAARKPSAEWVAQWADRARVLVAEAQAVGLAGVDVRRHLDEILDG